MNRKIVRLQVIVVGHGAAPFGWEDNVRFPNMIPGPLPICPYLCNPPVIVSLELAPAPMRVPAIRIESAHEPVDHLSARVQRTWVSTGRQTVSDGRLRFGEDVTRILTRCEAHRLLLRGLLALRFFRCGLVSLGHAIRAARAPCTWLAVHSAG
jgi:hypothetical protein